MKKLFTDAGSFLVKEYDEAGNVVGKTSFATEAEAVAFINGEVAPSAPTEPTVPTEPTAPVAPEVTEPVAPTEPTEPTAPAEGTDIQTPSSEGTLANNA